MANCGALLVVLALCSASPSTSLVSSETLVRRGRGPALRLSDRPAPEVRPTRKLLQLRGGSGGGGGAAVGDYSQTTLVSLVTNRGGWLAVFLLSLSLTSVVMSGFEEILEEQIELAYFVPLLIGHGGNAGGQTVGAVLGALSAGQVTLADWASVIVKEALAGLGAGTLTCVAVGQPNFEPQQPTPWSSCLHDSRSFTRMAFESPRWQVVPLLLAMKISRHVSAAILLTMPVLTVMASVLGAALPFATLALGVDPAVVAGMRSAHRLLPAASHLVLACPPANRAAHRS